MQMVDQMLLMDVNQYYEVYNEDPTLNQGVDLAAECKSLKHSELRSSRQDPCDPLY